MNFSFSVFSTLVVSGLKYCLTRATLTIILRPFVKSNSTLCGPLTLRILKGPENFGANFLFLLRKLNSFNSTHCPSWKVWCEAFWSKYCFCLSVAKRLFSTARSLACCSVPSRFSLAESGSCMRLKSGAKKAGRRASIP